MNNQAKQAIQAAIELLNQAQGELSGSEADLYSKIQDEIYNLEELIED